MDLYDVIAHAVKDGAAAFRVRAKMQPVGGEGSTVYPPTYSVPDSFRTKYAVESPIRVDGGSREDENRFERALLMSVAQGAHGLQDALQDLIDEGRIELPNVEVDFTAISTGEGQDSLADLGVLSSLQVPHRVYDAILRDSVIEVDPKHEGDRTETLFRLSTEGSAITEASPKNATAIYDYAPEVLLFGGWDSTGPKGGLGAKFERAITSEIVAHDVRLGVKVGSRIDPLQIQQIKELPIFKSKIKEEAWVLDGSLAHTNNGQPVLYKGRGNDTKPGRPSNINHGNVAPSIDSRSGGIVMDHAIHTLVLSLGTLRKLRFATYSDGTAVPREKRADVNRAAQTVIAALGVLAIAARMEKDFALRSRCHLINTEPWKLELVGKYIDDVQEVSVSVDDAIKAFEKAVAEAGSDETKMKWHAEPLRLKPAEKLVALIQASRKVIKDQEELDGE